MYRLARSLLFRLPAETAHHFIIRTLANVPAVVRLAAPCVTAPKALEQTLWNIRFPHPVGLAAGLDKDGVAVDGLLRCGFSYVEAGTVTPRPQPGNPAPRLFRLTADEALINRMGFNNQGGQALRTHLMKRRHPGVIGVNIGKNKTTPNEDAADDYTQLLRVVYPVADYIAINVSSPNTPGLRELQSEAALVPLVQAVVQTRDEVYESQRDRIRPHRPPVLVKLAPDLPDEAITSLAGALLAAGAEGFIATNTTLARDGLKSEAKDENGGLSGRPLKERATEVIRLIYSATAGSVPIIGCGGVFSADDAYEKISAGASLVQVYTGFIYQGPQIVKNIVEGLNERLKQDGLNSLQDAVGTWHKTKRGT